MIEHASNGRFFHVLGDIAHWDCECGQPNSEGREECVSCGAAIPEGTFDKFKRNYPNKGRFGRK